MSIEAEDDEYLKSAAVAGSDAGKAVGSWVIDGNTSTERCEEILKGIENGDPAIMDMCPSPLSGENAGSSIPEIAHSLGFDADDDTWHDIYEMSYIDGFWHEVERSARASLGPDADPYYKHPEDV